MEKSINMKKVLIINDIKIFVIAKLSILRNEFELLIQVNDDIRYC
jgi:hypothetical protein